MTRRGRRVGLLLAASAVALLGVEAGIRWLAPQSLSGSWLTPSGRGYAVNRRSTTATHRTPGRSVLYRLNSLGFRGPEPAPHGKRILVLGDSVTFGWLLDEPQTYVSQLASQASAQWGAGRLSFMNAAVGGWGTADYAAFVEDRGDELRPDVVVVFAGGDDVRRTWLSPLWTLAADGMVSRHPLPETGPGIRIIAGLPGYNSLIEHSHVAQLLRQGVIRARLTTPETTTPLAQTSAARELAERIFVRLAHWCQSRGVGLLVTTGSLREFTPEPESADPTAAFLGDADRFFARLRVPYRSVAKAHGSLSEPIESFVIPGDGHLNERGAKLIADTTWPWLRQQLQGVVEGQRR